MLEHVKNQIRGSFYSEEIPFGIYERVLDHSIHVKVGDPVDKFGFTRHCFEFEGEAMSLKRKGEYCELFGKIELVQKLVSLWRTEYKI